MAVCPKCGTETNARFCTNCGTQIPTAPPAAPPPFPQPPVAAAAAPQYQAPPTFGTQPPAPPAPGLQYQAPQAPQAPGYQYGAMPQPAPAPGTVWQGVLVLILGIVTAAFILLGLSATPGDADAKLGAVAISALSGLFVLIFGIWGLVKNKTGGKVMSGIGIALWAIALIASLAH